MFAASQNLRVALATELAQRLRDGEEQPADLLVPTKSDLLLPVGEVYLDDAPWNTATAVEVLHPRLSHADGRQLGCTSVRDELAARCVGLDVSEEDAFGQEADLVDEVKRLLSDYSGQADVFAEFVQNTDDFGAEEFYSVLCPKSFATERIVDERSAELQGPSLYICSSKPLQDEDIRQMQRVGRSGKRLDFGSAGRFGVGLNVMYRYSDCPQLLANGWLHFFDLTKSFVARGERRGRQFRTDDLRRDFPHTMEPFLASGLADRYPVVFRLPLRRRRSELGSPVSARDLKVDLRAIAVKSEEMLLFTKHLKKLTFQDDGGLIAEHDVTFEQAGDEANYGNFFRNLPATLTELEAAQQDTKLVVKKSIQSRITTEQGLATSKVQWVVAHHVQLSSQATRALAQQLFDGGTALLPHGAAAAKLSAQGQGEAPIDSGKMCCCLPTPIASGCRAWLHGSFVLGSSRKVIPLPEEYGQSLGAKWNQQLLEGPVASSLCEVLVCCRDQVSNKASLAHYFELLPGSEKQVTKNIAVATLRASLGRDIFPVASADTVRWVSGPTPVLRSGDLGEPVQDALSADGLDLVMLPDRVLQQYKRALSESEIIQVLNAQLLGNFLQQRWRQVHGPRPMEVPIENAGTSALSRTEHVLELLGFVMRSDWMNRLASGPAPEQYDCQHLLGVPLLLTEARTLTSFGQLKFSDHRSLLPRRPSLFMARSALKAIHDNVDRQHEAVRGRVRIDVPGVRPLRLQDLLPFKAEMEALCQTMEGLNDLWNFFADKDTPVDWQVQLAEWRILPVYGKLTTGRVSLQPEAALLPLRHSPSTVVLGRLQGQAAFKEKLAQALLGCGVHLLNEEILLSSRLGDRVLPSVVCSDEDALQLLFALQETHGAVDQLSPAHRLTILAYCSVLQAGGSDVTHVVRQLPLFKLAQQQGFTELSSTLTYCCINPGDPHAGALERLLPPGAEILAWPTAEAKPIYEACNVNICSGETFMEKFVLPHLPTICAAHNAGNNSEPYLKELHAFVVKEKSQTLIQMARRTAFVPDAAGTSMHTPGSLVDPSALAAPSFLEVLKSSLPAAWLCTSRVALELLRALGLRLSLPPQLLLICARYLDSLAGSSDGMTVRLLAMSHDLVEGLAHAMAFAAVSEDAAATGLLKAAASLRVLLVRSFSSDVAVSEEAQRRCRAMRATQGARLEQLSLAAFQGTAFDSACRSLWSVCPSEFHFPANKNRNQLDHLLQHCRKYMEESLGAHVKDFAAPCRLVVQHLHRVCTLLHADKEAVAVSTGSLMYKAPVKQYNER
ncbi:unnamed protein product [Polarella glacialis]|uniref:Sacsin/Nov domain-containing protein n=1 Tax=Polarella glacialis TaxID=89957 RepID=A0A813KCN9_POLGL|nr:unnamed protein product [Polarella glacialis]